MRIYYESHLAKVNLSEEGEQLIKVLDYELGKEEITDTQKAMATWIQLDSLVGGVHCPSIVPSKLKSSMRYHHPIWSP